MAAIQRFEMWILQKIELFKLRLNTHINKRE